MVAISFTSGKGGTGKTTMVLNLGAALADMGKDVTIVDADLLTHSLSVLCQMENKEGLAQLFVHRNFPIEKAIHRFKGLRDLKVIPSSETFHLLSKMRTLLSRKRDFVANRMNEIADYSEYVLIDTPAGISREVLFAVSIGDAYCLVSEMGPADLEGVLVINMLAREIGLSRFGMIFNRVRSAPPEKLKRVCGKTFGPILGLIPFDIRFIEAFEERGLPFFSKNRNALASKEIRKVADGIVKSVQERKFPEVKHWSSFRWDNLKEIPDILGVYELADEDDNVIYIGAGRLRTRLLTLKSENHIMKARKLRYRRISDRKICNRRLDLMISAFKRKHGRVPLYNQKSQE